MTYIIDYEAEGTRFATKELSEKEKNSFAGALDGAGIKYQILTRDNEKMHRLCRVVFEMRDVAPAMGNPDYKYSYTFVDPNGFSKDHKAVIAKCASGEEKTVFVISTWLETETKIIALRDKLKAEGKLKSGRLSRIVGCVM